jgi:hypothetical protein
MEFPAVVLFLVWISLGVQMGRKRSCGGLAGGFVCLFLGPIGLLVLLTSPKRDDQTNRPNEVSY